MTISIGLWVRVISCLNWLIKVQVQSVQKAVFGRQKMNTACMSIGGHSVRATTN